MQDQPAPSAHFRETLKMSQWPKHQVFNAPLKAKSGAVEDAPLAFLLPHELIFQLVNQGDQCLEVLQDPSGLDETCLAHVTRLSTEWEEKVVPVSLWQDGVPYNWDRGESLEIFSLSLPGLACPKERNLRFPLTVAPHHMSSKATFQRIFEILAWSFVAMAKGVWPEAGPGGAPYKHRQSSRPLGFVAALAEMKGDWKMMAEVIGLPSWNQNAGICWRCNLTLEQIDQVGEDSPWRLPENKLSHGDLLMLSQARGPLCKVFDFAGFSSNFLELSGSTVQTLAFLPTCLEQSCTSLGQTNLRDSVWCGPCCFVGMTLKVSAATGSKIATQEI